MVIVQGITKPHVDEIHFKLLGDNYHVGVTVAYEQQCLLFVLIDEQNAIGEALFGAVTWHKDFVLLEFNEVNINIISYIKLNIIAFSYSQLLKLCLGYFKPI